jgi:hypothetical protein
MQKISVICKRIEGVHELVTPLHFFLGGGSQIVNQRKLPSLRLKQIQIMYRTSEWQLIPTDQTEFEL